MFHCFDSLFDDMLCDARIANLLRVPTASAAAIQYRFMVSLLLGQPVAARAVLLADHKAFRELLRDQEWVELLKREDLLRVGVVGSWGDAIASMLYGSEDDGPATWTTDLVASAAVREAWLAGGSVKAEEEFHRHMSLLPVKSALEKLAKHFGAGESSILVATENPPYSESLDPLLDELVRTRVGSSQWQDETIEELRKTRGRGSALRLLPEFDDPSELSPEAADVLRAVVRATQYQQARWVGGDLRENVPHGRGHTKLDQIRIPFCGRPLIGIPGLDTFNQLLTDRAAFAGLRDEVQDAFQNRNNERCQDAAGRLSDYVAKMFGGAPGTLSLTTATGAGLVVASVAAAGAGNEPATIVGAATAGFATLLEISVPWAKQRIISHGVKDVIMSHLPITCPER